MAQTIKRPYTDSLELYRRRTSVSVSPSSQAAPKTPLPTPTTENGSNPNRRPSVAISIPTCPSLHKLETTSSAKTVTFVPQTPPSKLSADSVEFANYDSMSPSYPSLQSCMSSSETLALPMDHPNSPMPPSKLNKKSNFYDLPGAQRPATDIQQVDESPFIFQSVTRYSTETLSCRGSYTDLDGHYHTATEAKAEFKKACGEWAIYNGKCHGRWCIFRKRWLNPSNLKTRVTSRVASPHSFARV